MPSGIVKLVESAVFTPPGAMALTRMFGLGELHGERAGELDDGALGHAVGDRVRLAHDPGVGGDVDDVAAGLEQVGDGRLAEVERRVHVHRDHQRVVALGHLGHVHALGDAGHVAEDVELAERLDRGGHGVDALVAGGDVADAGVDGAAGPGDGLGGLGQALGVHVVAEDSGALGRQADGGGPPDAGAGPGDQRDLAGEAALHDVPHDRSPHCSSRRTCDRCTPPLWPSSRGELGRSRPGAYPLRVGRPRVAATRRGSDGDQGR